MGIIHRFNSIEDGEFRWQDVPVSAYGPENSRADRATRQILIGIQYNQVVIPHWTSMHTIMVCIYCMVGRAFALATRSMSYKRATLFISRVMKCTSSLQSVMNPLAFYVSFLQNGKGESC